MHDHRHQGGASHGPIHEGTGEPGAHGAHDMHQDRDMHGGHDKHAGHSVAMFRDKFWL